MRFPWRLGMRIWAHRRILSLRWRTSLLTQDYGDRKRTLGLWLQVHQALCMEALQRHQLAMPVLWKLEQANLLGLSDVWRMGKTML
jgi:hypothetical protein